MAEILRIFEEPVIRRETDTRYVARVCGRPAADGRWEGWLEFVPTDGSAILRSQRETTQPNRTDTVYWASGLGAVYVEGALQRTLEPKRPVYEAPKQEPAYAGPAPVHRRHDGEPVAVIDPLEVCATHGKELLRDELSALGEQQLENVVRAYDLADERSADVDAMGKAELVELIVRESERRVG